MPRASWKGFLRLSLVSCPVYLAPATTRTKSVRLRQVWVPREPSAIEELPEAAEEQEDWPPPRAINDRRVPHADDEPESEVAEAEEHDEDQAAHAFGPATPIALRPHDPHTGQEIERDDVRKGYEYERGQFVTFSPAELKALDVESSHTIDLTSFVSRADVDPIYFNAAYYVYPDGAIAAEAYRVISAAMAEAGMAGLGRL